MTAKKMSTAAGVVGKRQLAAHFPCTVLETVMIIPA